MLRLWHQLGFMKEKERIVFLLIYVTATHELSYKQLNTMMDECKLKGDEIMPTLAQRWMEEGMLAGKLQDLIMLLSSRFPVSEYDKQIVLNVQEPERLNEALKLVINAQAKEEVLARLQDFRNS